MFWVSLFGCSLYIWLLMCVVVGVLNMGSGILDRILRGKKIVSLYLTRFSLI